MPTITVFPFEEIREYQEELEKLKLLKAYAAEEVQKLESTKTAEQDIKLFVTESKKYASSPTFQTKSDGKSELSQGDEDRKHAASAPELNLKKRLESEAEKQDVGITEHVGLRRKKFTKKLKALAAVQWRISKAQVPSRKDKDFSSKSNINLDFDDDGNGPAPEATRFYRYGGYPTICFNLTSRRAHDEGWIVNQPPETDLGEKNLLEWATNRLRIAMKEREREDEEAVKNGATKPVLIRYYGDSRRDTLLKLYRKGAENEKSSMSLGNLIPGKKAGAVPKIPQLTKLDSGQKDEFMVQLPDGSISVFYPKTGNTAIVGSAVPGEAGQLYLHCFSNDPERNPLASFTPYGKSCCYHKNGDPGMILTEEGGVIKTESGTIQQKWLWPREGVKLTEPIDFQLNKEMNVRVIGRHTVNLYFTSNRESVKIPVGAVPGVDVPQGLHKVSSAMLQSGFGLSLKAAVEFANMKDGKSKHRARKDRFRRTGTSMHRKPAEIEALRQGLDPPERFEFDSQADRELHRLGVKTKHLVDDWMEHYRVALGMASPALKRMLDKPKVRFVDRRIQSARERRLPSEEQEFEENNKKFQSFRSPSAPPRHMMPGPHSLTVEDKRSKPGKRTSPDKRSPDTPHHVRIEMQPIVVESEPVIEPYKPAESVATTREIKTRPSTQAYQHSSRHQALDRRKTISASAIVSGDRRKSRKATYALLCDCCPVVTRAKLLNADTDSPKILVCKCSKHKIPMINDIELDYFLHRVAPITQLIVVCVINSLHPKASPYDKMLDHMYITRNKNRSQPCRQSKYDQYRIFYYDLAVAKSGTKRSVPLLLSRHNAVPGMALMYCGGRLLFADHIFNGYGNARQDFRKQICQSRRDYSLGHFLPDDFRFTPQRGKSGPRAAWGGEVGGAGVNGKGEPGMFFNDNSIGKSLRKGLRNKLRDSVLLTDTTASDVTSKSSLSVRLPQSRSFDSARDFIQFSLSTQVYFGQPSKRRDDSNAILTTRSAMERELTPSYLPVSHSAIA